ncbi:MAG TPA: protein rep [Dehalococcoidia bacterium]|nr:protein rep [Dehalococcoidia bacterium]
MLSVAKLSGDHSSPATVSALPLVHNKETSVRYALPDTYQAHRAGFDLRAWQRSGDFYYHVDDILQSNYVERWERCRRRAWFARHVVTGEVRVFSSACRLRWCSLCSTARRNWITHTVAEWVREASYPKFLTVTLKHSNAPLLHQVNSLYEYFRKFRHAKFVADSAIGGIWFFQIKRSKTSGQWHPHIHCVIEGKYMAQRKLSELWSRLTCGSKIVDIRPIRDPVKAASEVARYASSPADISTMDPNDYVEVFQSLHSRKACGTWGSARKVSLKQPAAADADSWRSVGDWGLVRETQGQFLEADMILKAWLTQTPLEEGISMREVERHMLGEVINAVIEKPHPYLPGFYDSS